MSNFIIHNYITWLQAYGNSPKGESESTIVQSITQQLTKATNIDVVVKILKLRTKNSPASNSMFSHSQVAVPEEVQNKMLIWQGELEQIKTNHQQAKESLDLIPRDDKNTKLLDLLYIVINAPKTLLHSSALSLCKILNDKNIVDVISYLVNLKEAPPSPNFFKGSFNAVEAKGEVHIEGKKLQNTLNFHFDEHNRLWQQANGLMQNTMLIYQDLYQS